MKPGRVLIASLVSMTLLLGAGCSSDPETPEPGADLDRSPQEPSEAAAEELVGLPEDVATEIAVDRGWTPVRVTSRDGESFPITADFVSNRLNIDVEDAVVTSASFG